MNKNNNHCNEIKSGLIKGTRVYTPDGKVRIEEIKIGDYVLSSPINDPTIVEHKRVTKLFNYDQQPIIHISIGQQGWEWPDPLDVVITTKSHHFLVNNQGWIKAENLITQQQIRQGDGGLATISGINYIYRTGKQGIGWLPNTSDITNRGNVFDYQNYMVATDDDKKKYEYLPEETLSSSDKYLHVPVYDIEVEDFHSYYVGGIHGFLVKSV